MASTMKIDRKTLFNLFRAAQLPPPSLIISWCRVLVATQLLEDPETTVDGIARTLDHTSGTSLRNIIRRYLGVTPTELRNLGPVDFSTDRFVSFIDRNRSTVRLAEIPQAR
jgi:transcriptional regulator GlxA family with amidase domain